MQISLDFPWPPDDQVDEAITEHGVVYTRPWVVDFILDLVGYVPNADLSRQTILEPSFGHGAFLVEIARRLVRSMKTYRRSWKHLESSIVAVELSPKSHEIAKTALLNVLLQNGAPENTAEELLGSWLRLSDYLLDDHLFSRRPDLIVGNPPYIRHEAIPNSKLSQYRKTYHAMRGRSDLYIGFFEKSLRLLPQNGLLGFICADRWTLNSYGKGLRSLISDHYAIDAIIDMHEADAFTSDVLAYPSTFLIRRGSYKDTAVAKVSGRPSPRVLSSLKSSVLRQASDTSPTQAHRVSGYNLGSAPWPRGTPNRIRLLRQLEARFPVVEDVGIKVGIGIATGNDRVFITSNPELVEADRLLPLALAKDIKNGHLKWSNHYLINPWKSDGLVTLRDFPDLRAYLQSHRDSLTRRHVAQRNPDKWYRTIDRPVEQLQTTLKILIPDIKGKLVPVLDKGETYPHHNLYYMTSNTWPINSLGGVLLSGIAEFFVESYCTKMSGGFLRFQAQFLRRICLPPVDQVSDALLAALAEAFRRRDADRAFEISLEVYGIDRLPSD